jgi:sucrose-6F-phosphate phosphohydrolase
MIFSVRAATRETTGMAMEHPKLLLCTDLDRTIIPNGRQDEHPRARHLFRRFCAKPEVRLVYVSGRHLELVQKAIADYRLPPPDHVITDVGTTIYDYTAGAWLELRAWRDQFAEAWRGKGHAELHRVLAGNPVLRLQEQDKQNDYKLSYYATCTGDSAKLLEWVGAQLSRLGIAVSLIWSIDEPARIGLLDIVPRGASKLHAIEFLRQRLGYRREETVFAGDSGNDLTVLASAIPAILVANAEDDVKEQARRLAHENGWPEKLYIARNEGFRYGGDYAAGVLQGLSHFVPQLMPLSAGETR